MLAPSVLSLFVDACYLRNDLRVLETVLALGCILLLSEWNLVVRQDLPLNVHLCVHYQVKLLKGFLLQHGHVDRRHALFAHLAGLFRVKVLSDRVVVKILQSLVHELLTSLGLHTWLLPHVLLQSVSVGWHLEIFDRDPVLDDILVMPVLQLVLLVDADGLCVWRGQLEFIQIFVALPGALCAAQLLLNAEFLAGGLVRQPRDR